MEKYGWHPDPDPDPNPDDHPDHWDNKLTLEAQTLHIAKRTRTQVSSS